MVLALAAQVYVQHCAVLLALCSIYTLTRFLSSKVNSHFKLTLTSLPNCSAKIVSLTFLFILFPFSTGADNFNCFASVGS